MSTKKAKMNRKEIIRNLKKGNLVAFGSDLEREARNFSTTVEQIASERYGWSYSHVATLLIIDFPERYEE